MKLDYENVIDEVKKYWDSQYIQAFPIEEEGLNKYIEDHKIELPKEFKKLYLTRNGMESHFPNNLDVEGFLFYPLKEVCSLKSVFPKTAIPNAEKIYIFAEYMHQSWWYGFENLGEEKYSIGIIPFKNKYKPICYSLQKFLKLYLDDSPILYDYK